MIQRRPFHSQEQKLKNKIDEGLTDLPRFRYLIDIPECSAVVQNPQCHRNLQTSQASLFEKIVVDNEKNYSSSLFDENKEKMFDTKLVEEMRFSFSNHFKKDPEENSKQLPSRHQQSECNSNLQSSLAEKSHQSQRQALVRSNTKDIANQSIETIKNKYLNKKQKGESFLQGKEKKIVIQDSKAFKKESINFSKSYISQKQGKNEVRGQQKNLEGVFKQINLNKKLERKSQTVLSNSVISSDFPQLLPSKEKQSHLITKKIVQQQVMLIPKDYFEMLFNRLDASKISVLDHHNCAKQRLSDQIKLILGPIWYRIQYCDHSIKMIEFVELALKIYSLLPQQKMIQILSQSKDKIIAFQSQKQKREMFQCEKCAQFYPSANISPLSSSPDRLNMPIRAISPDRYYKSTLTNFSLTKKAYVDLQETRYQRQRQELLANDPAKYSPSKNKFKSVQGHDYASYKNLVRVSPKREILQKMSVIKEQEHSYEGRVDLQIKKALAMKKKRNISQSMIREHKQNLSDLQKLNAKIEVYMSNRPELVNNYKGVW